MRKEVLIAIIIGFGLGLLITYGIWTANKAIKQKAEENQEAPSEEIAETIKPSPTPTPAGLLLTISSPEDNLIADKNKVQLSGKTEPGATVVVLYEGGEKILEADQDGKFNAEITLVSGSNEINVSAFAESGEEANKKLTVVFSTAEI